MADRLEYVRLAELLRGFEGKWVAIRAGEIIEARETPDQLVMALRARGVTDVVVMRSPGLDEPEMVGLG